MLRRLLNRLGHAMTNLGDAAADDRSAGAAHANLPLAERKAQTTSPADRTASVRLFTFDLLGPTAVITVVERHLTATIVAELLYQLRDLLSRQPQVRNLVLDLQNVDYLDSACLNMLITLLQAVKSAGGRIAIASAQRSIEVLFKLTRLDSLFPIQRDVLGAIHAVETSSHAA